MFQATLARKFAIGARRKLPYQKERGSDRLFGTGQPSGLGV